MSSDHDAARGLDGRVRRSTIERFNDELAILDRPLEGEVEYYDDPRPRSGWRRVGPVVGALALLGAGAAGFKLRSASAGEGGDRPSIAAALPAVAPAQIPAASPLPAAAPAPVVQDLPVQPAAHEPADDADSVAAPTVDTGPWRLQPSRRAWANLRPAAVHEKAAGETAHRSTSRHHGRHR
jgi:hypothetical protein